MSLELGYEDDAMVVNECLWRKAIDKMKGKQLNIDDIEEKNIIVATAKKIKMAQYNRKEMDSVVKCPYRR